MSEPLPSGPDRWNDQRVMYCGHDGWFRADIIVTPFAVTVMTKGLRPLRSDQLKRSHPETAEWFIREIPGVPVYWSPATGIFVLSRASVKKLK